jgi:pimeloyl-ACP methyl ester carboxylesterase
VYGLIQVGRFVADTRAALDWMERERGLRRFIVGGLCGGAITGLLEGQDDPRVVGLLALGLPVILDGSSLDKRRFMTSGQLDSWRAGYFRKLRDPQSWLRLLTLRTDFWVLFKTLFEPVRNRMGLRRRKVAGDNKDDLNPKFPSAYERFISAKKEMLLIFSGADRLYAEYEEKFVARYPELVARAKTLSELHVVENANHIFSLEEWQREMLDLSCDWLSARFGGRTQNRGWLKRTSGSS